MLELFFCATLALKGRLSVPPPLIWLPPPLLCPSLPLFFSSFFSLPADSESWLAPAVFGDMVIQDHHFRVPRDRSQHGLLFLFVAFTKRGCSELLIFSPAKLQIFLCLPIRHFPKRIQENPRVSIADLAKGQNWGGQTFSGGRNSCGVLKQLKPESRPAEIQAPSSPKILTYECTKTANRKLKAHLSDVASLTASG